MMEKPRFSQAIVQSIKPLYGSLPIIAGAILLVSLANSIIPKTAYGILFSKNIVLDSIIGSALGSILLGNPITSYIFGGELLNQGVSLVAVTAFLVAWVTVGLVQLPAESIMLGKRFAIVRNLVSFVFAILVAIVTVGVMNLI